MSATEQYMKGYRQGFIDGHDTGKGINIIKKRSDFSDEFLELVDQESAKTQRRKFTNSPKQKLLSEMTNKKWNVYKKGSGKKTWIQIRGEVSRSQVYKKKAKRL